MPNKPSDIVRMYRSVARSAACVGQEFVLNEKRLEPMFSQAQIDAIFAELDYIKNLERMIDGRLAALDAMPQSPDLGQGSDQ